MLLPVQLVLQNVWRFRRYTSCQFHIITYGLRHVSNGNFFAMSDRRYNILAFMLIKVPLDLKYAMHSCFVHIPFVSTSCTVFSTSDAAWKIMMFTTAYSSWPMQFRYDLGTDSRQFVRYTFRRNKKNSGMLIACIIILPTRPRPRPAEKQWSQNSKALNTFSGASGMKSIRANILRLAAALWTPLWENRAKNW